MVDWQKADLELVREILREAEITLQSQLSLAIAADQRSAVMASLFTAAAAAIVAGLITLASAEHPAHAASIYAGGAISILLLMAGASFCIWAARPVNFSVPGNVPQNWYDDIARQRDLKPLLGEQAENYQEMIDDNNQQLRTNSRRFMLGAILGLAAPLAGFAAWGLLRLSLP